MKDMWETKLMRDFPDQNITVSFPEDDSDDLTDYEVTFFIARKEDLTVGPNQYGPDPT